MYDINQLPLDTLKATKLNDKLEMVEVPVPIIIRDDTLYLDCETDAFVADYYQEFGIEIDPAIRQWATDNGGYWEWYDPGTLQFCRD